MNKVWTVIGASVLVILVASAPRAQQNQMSFFVTSAGSGMGGNLGGLDGADKTVPTLAKAAGATAGTWRAYLSTQGTGAVNARDRIGKGPWRNAKGMVIAQNVDDLHGAKANLTKETLLTEKGQPVNGRGDKPNQHDVLTGSQMNGRGTPTTWITRATTGRAAAREARRSVIPIAWDWPTRKRRNRGTALTRAKDAARRTWSRRVARVTSIASRIRTVTRPRHRAPGR